MPRQPNPCSDRLCTRGQFSVMPLVKLRTPYGKAEVGSVIHDHPLTHRLTDCQTKPPPVYVTIPAAMQCKPMRSTAVPSRMSNEARSESCETSLHSTPCNRAVVRPAPVTPPTSRAPSGGSVHDFARVCDASNAYISRVFEHFSFSSTTATRPRQRKTSTDRTQPAPDKLQLSNSRLTLCSLPLSSPLSSRL